jgi:hypothetical protein
MRSTYGCRCGYKHACRIYPSLNVTAAPARVGSLRRTPPVLLIIPEHQRGLHTEEESEACHGFTPSVVYSLRAANADSFQTGYDQPIDHLGGGADDAIRSGICPRRERCPHAAGAFPSPPNSSYLQNSQPVSWLIGRRLWVQRECDKIPRNRVNPYHPCTSMKREALSMNSQRQHDPVPPGRRSLGRRLSRHIRPAALGTDPPRQVGQWIGGRAAEAAGPFHPAQRPRRDSPGTVGQHGAPEAPDTERVAAAPAQGSNHPSGADARNRRFRPAAPARGDDGEQAN